MYYDNRRAYTKEDKWEFKYRRSDGVCRVVYPKTKEQIAKNKEICKDKGYEVVSVKKLYPISTMKNQHNFGLIHNIAWNELWDIEHGEKKGTDEDIERLEKLIDRSGEFMSLPLPVAWLPWEDWKEAKEMYESAIIHRQEACIANGRPDLVTYC